jgi:hypothetical protein
MDPHFNEYLAAIAGMNDLYGPPACDETSEFHEPLGEPTNPEPAAA